MQSPRETRLCQYSYDALDRLIANALPNEPEHQRFYCRSRLATEIRGAVRYSIVQYDDWLLAQQQSEGDALETTLPATDQHRSILNTLKANHPRHPIAYAPYGHRPVGGALLSLLGFNGERPDPVTGSYLLGNGYRAFNPVLMRFTSPDSLSPFEKGGLNSFTYCLGDPINRHDPNGHISFALTVKMQNWARRAVAKVATKTNSIALYPDRSLSKVPLSSNVSPTRAAQLRSRATHLDNLRLYEMQANFENTLTSARNSTRHQTLQKLSINKIQTSNLPIDDLPPTLQSAAHTPSKTFNQHALLEYLNQDQPFYGVNTERFDHNKLIGISTGEFIFHFPSLNTR
ncbi:RHS repeat-associated core domain-containing protein [Pseudomonas sp. PCH199]|uniref:RHS repeat-associated core domain-containing protein n=1 Tax=unclassified Pseudomonas TaxID=196821 RepID=UPI000BC507DC|nr:MULTISPECIES: RHS repeat-associated core domain-containing protein [unclassified Pseudomonas]MCW8275665.1 RHS repeat-associated core domain-containing protein [Pseudomonas sp. PCH199]PAM84536.1 hypothetical protein CES87_08285 [Pseudomonas sp. ERMR1:02]